MAEPGIKSKEFNSLPPLKFPHLNSHVLLFLTSTTHHPPPGWRWKRKNGEKLREALTRCGESKMRNTTWSLWTTRASTLNRTTPRSWGQRACSTRLRVSMMRWAGGFCICERTPVFMFSMALIPGNDLWYMKEDPLRHVDSCFKTVTDFYSWFCHFKSKPHLSS